MKFRKIYLSQLVGGGYGDYWRTEKRYRVCKGSRGSKKSKTTALNVICRTLKYPQASTLCVRRYGNTLRDSMFSDLQWAIHRLGLDREFISTVSPMQIVRPSTGQKILFRGLDEGTKITSVSVERGCLCFVWVEEAFEIREADFDKLDMSIRGEVPEGYFKQITLTFNPWSATSWLKARFFDKPDSDVFTKTTTWECNEWLDNADRSVFLKMKKENPRRYAIEGEGEWGIAEGLIFDNVLFEAFDVNEIKRLEGIKPAFGLDFGYVDPNAFICALVDNAEGKIYVFDEWYRNGVTNRIIAQTIKDMGYGGQTIICDCAESKSIRELTDEGIHAKGSSKGPDSVNYGIQKIQNYQIIVHPRCEGFRHEILNYCWEKDKDGKPTGRPDHEFSHGMDALRYAVTGALAPSVFSFD